jgi:ribosomal protein S8
MNKNLVEFLIKLKNASQLKKETVYIQYNTFQIEVLKKLYEEGVVQSFFLKDSSSILVVNLRFFLNKPTMGGIKLLSTPSLKNTLSFIDISKINSVKYTIILTTNLGIKTLDECKIARVGGQMLFLC